MKRIVVYFIFFSVCTTAVFAQLWPKGELKQTDWNISLKKIKVGDVLEQEYYSCFGGESDTAWCEGAEGDGIGEVVIAWVDVKRPVRIWTGFGKNENLWRANNRPKEVEVFIKRGNRRLVRQRSEFQNDGYRRKKTYIKRYKRLAKA